MLVQEPVEHSDAVDETLVYLASSTVRELHSAVGKCQLYTLEDEKLEDCVKMNCCQQMRRTLPVLLLGASLILIEALKVRHTLLSTIYLVEADKVGVLSILQVASETSTSALESF